MTLSVLITFFFTFLWHNCLLKNIAYFVISPWYPICIHYLLYPLFTVFGVRTSFYVCIGIEPCTDEYCMWPHTICIPGACQGCLVGTIQGTYLPIPQSQSVFISLGKPQIPLLVIWSLDWYIQPHCTPYKSLSSYKIFFSSFALDITVLLLFFFSSGSSH